MPNKPSKIALVILTLFIIFLTGCKNSTNHPSQPDQAVSEETKTEESSEENTAEVLEVEDSEVVSSVVIRSIGDILIHNTVYADAATDSGYDFNHMFDPIRPYLENADITTANLEMIVAGSEFGVSTYPNFNSPAEILSALKNSGVDIVNNATNHSYDWGSAGAYASIENLITYDMMYAGSYQSWDDYKQPRIIEANGIKVGFLAYANDANGLIVPDDEAYLLSLIDLDVMSEEIKALNDLCDVSVVMAHMGQEYEFMPNEWQYEVAKVAREAGANFVLGGHPHVVLPFVRYNENQAAWFSHGNFLTGQYEEETKIGGIGEYTFNKLTNGEVVLAGIRFMPTYNLGMPETSVYSVVPLADADQYGFYNGEAWFDELSERLAYFTEVEVVDYLD